MIEEPMPWGKNRWEQGAFLEPMRAAYDATSASLSVTFRDGETVLVPVSMLDLADRGAQWEGVRAKPRLAVRVPVRKGQGDHGASYVDLPGDVLRSLVDADFAAHLARSAEEHAHQVGAVLRRLRETRGLTTTALAQRVGMPQQSISRIENGRHDVSFGTLQKILAALGYTLHDLLPPRDAPGETRTRESA